LAMRIKNNWKMGAIFLSLIFCALISRAYAADESIIFDYDIYTANDSIAIWVDLTPILTQPVLEDLLAGLDIFLSLRFKIEKSQKPFGHNTVYESKTDLLLTHNLTKDNYNISYSLHSQEKRSFSNQMDLSDYLADSLQFKPISLGQLNANDKYRLNVEIISRSISPLEVNQNSEFSNGVGQSPEDNNFLGSVLDKFLEIVGFGEITYRIISPQFKIDQLETETD
jgi:hypothetical protein